LQLLTRNVKTKKSEALFPEYRVRIMHLAPAKISGKEVCAGRSPGCTAACLFTAGFGRFTNVRKARIERTKLYWKSPTTFESMLRNELDSNVRCAERDGKSLAVRLNGTSDLNFIYLLRCYPWVQFYDYTKVWLRWEDEHKRPTKNYHLIWSASEINEEETRKVVERGGSVAWVGRPPLWARVREGKWLPAVDGDEHDLRFMDPKGAVVWLKAKGKAKRDKTGFVRGA
jgi:hypothetical protein